MTPYEELAYAVCKVACDDYIDALILKNRGWLLSPEEVEVRRKRVLRKLWKAVLNYGDRRYIYRKQGDGRIVKQDQQTNIKKCNKIFDLLDEYEYFGGPDKTIRECETFFRSNRFALFMPDIDPEDLIVALQAKAAKGERSASFVF